MSTGQPSGASSEGGCFVGRNLDEQLQRDQPVRDRGTRRARGEFVKRAPRRLDMPVCFRVRPRGPAAQRPPPVVSGLHASAPVRHHHQERPGGSAGATRIAFPLDETAKYFLVLVALCEPRLRDCSTPIVPTVPQVLERLGDLPAARGLTRSAVNFHIDYLARTKLRVKSTGIDATGDGTAKADWQRAALISLALQFDLVREEHLALLPPLRRPTTSAAPSTSGRLGR